MSRVAGWSKTLSRAWHSLAGGIFGAAPYRGGEINRLNKGWIPQHFSGDGAIAVNWDMLIRRIRDLGRNDPAIIALRGALVDHVISTGITANADVMIGDDWEETFNEEADALFEEWAEGECDIEGRLALQDMERQLFRELLDTGECLALEVALPDSDRLVPICYQTIEAEQLDTAKDQPAGRTTNEIRRGIEFDAAGRRVAYWLLDAHPSDSYRTNPQSRRIPAERVIHISLPGRPSQSRGVSLYNAIIQSARDLDNYLGSELTSATIGSLLSVVHKTARPGVGLGFVGDGSDTAGEDEYGNPRIRLGRGIVCQVPRDDDVSVVNTNRPNSQARTFVDLILMLIGMGGGCSRYRLTRDYSGITYIAARAAQLDDKSGFRPMQGYFARQFVRPVYRRVLSQLVAYGRLTSLSPTQFEKQRRRWLRCEIQYPGWEQLDTEAETDSSLKRIAGGLSNRAIECAKLGYNWRRIDRQRARELAHEEKHLGPHGAAYSYDLPSTPKRKEQEAAPSKTDGAGDKPE